MEKKRSIYSIRFDELGGASVVSPEGREFRITYAADQGHGELINLVENMNERILSDENNCSSR